MRMFKKLKIDHYLSSALCECYCWFVSNASLLLNRRYCLSLKVITLMLHPSSIKEMKYFMHKKLWQESMVDSYDTHFPPLYTILHLACEQCGWRWLILSRVHGGSFPMQPKFSLMRLHSMESALEYAVYHQSLYKFLCGAYHVWLRSR
jgi:hypothetical protein